MQTREFCGAGDGARTKAVWGALSPVFVLALLWDALRGRSRPFVVDAARLLRILRPQPQVEHASCIPPEDPFVVVMNHYCFSFKHAHRQLSTIESWSDSGPGSPLDAHGLDTPRPQRDT